MHHMAAGSQYSNPRYVKPYKPINTILIMILVITLVFEQM